MKLIYSPWYFILSVENPHEEEKLNEVRGGQPFRMEEGRLGLHFNFPSECEKMTKVLQRLVGIPRADRILRNTGMFPIQREQVISIDLSGRPEELPIIAKGSL